LENSCGGAVASRLVRSTPDRAVRVPALTGDIVNAFLPPGIQISTAFNIRGSLAMD